MILRRLWAAVAAAVFICSQASAQVAPLLNPLPDPQRSTLGLVLEEFVTLPASVPTSGTPTDRRLIRHNRINMLAELPDGSGRLAVADLNGPLYLLGQDGGFIEYLNLNDHFTDIRNHAGLGSGFGYVAFHPEFAENGTFYTVHKESGNALQTQQSDFPEFGNAVSQSVITEWVANQPDASEFSGSSAEMMRITFGGGIHNVQQIGFNPTAAEGDDDYGLLYVLVGDGGNAVGTENPQDLSTPHGKIFRIDPMGTNGRTGEYGIPEGNPFVDEPGALPEIYAYGLRDPHRMSWDPSAGNRMFVAQIGEWQLEAVYEVQAGDNFGWPLREGPYLAENRQLYPLPANDAQFGFTYPVAAYDHDRNPGQLGDAGVAIAGGFVYRGGIDELNGYYVFTDLVQGHVFAARAGQMLRGEPLAPIERLRLYVDGVETTFANLNTDNDPDDGDDTRIDLRVGRDAAGELYLLSKGAGTIWRVVDADVITTSVNAFVFPGLAEHLVAYYDFDHPVESDTGFESDRGLSGTPIRLVNGETAQRLADDSPYVGAGLVLQTREVSGDNNDWKAGIWEAGGIASLGAFNQTKGITIAGWFKQTGQNPSPGYGAIGLAGVLSGTSEGHLVRALLEVYAVNGEQRLVALGRRLDEGASWGYAASTPWAELAPLGEWVHFAASFDYGQRTMRLYANGEELDGYHTSDGNPWAEGGANSGYSSSTDPAGFKIGGSYPQNTAEANPCNCRMDDLMFFNKALTPAELRAQFSMFAAGSEIAGQID